MPRAILIDPEKRTLKYVYMTGEDRAIATEFQRLLRVKNVTATHLNAFGISAPARMVKIAPLSGYRQEMTRGTFAICGHHIDGRALVVGEDARTGKMLDDCPFTLEQLKRFIS